ncbi:YD repeat-containing protein [Parabacteroides sp. PF5-5]|uniref:hypothetical protein n=1 Tax=unclassified Parabacteroides TaxID=2649774 RepID=UPI002476E82D|nr:MULTISPECIES: hypothetical protein [unclassified Parabacteroides]MDH6304288.1 YD repeat-containing protein [Parabacteroides sp. PH5-39]MDH6314997.1 YD repeat-containing protein [Parabacteroides sp. PF5-13]MDH6318657.1 YD repeat-containing protein [Parabacteroides sp. PH5-13]MDH6322387.1 YD repeat-containing protein [Parabacteroides sp. PH5-8]MDH6326478.1 YD repeat-containing protein [Parabacteroides sp. PH5-41]
MKTFKLIMATVIAILCFASCSSEEGGEKPDEKPATSLITQKLIAISDNNGYRMNFQRDKSGRIIKIYDTEGQSLEASYDKNRIYGTTKAIEGSIYTTSFIIALNDKGYASEMTVTYYPEDSEEWVEQFECHYNEEGYIKEKWEQESSAESHHAYKYYDTKISIISYGYPNSHSYDILLSNEENTGGVEPIILFGAATFGITELIYYGGFSGKPVSYLPNYLMNIKRDSEGRISSTASLDETVVLTINYHYE